MKSLFSIDQDNEKRQSLYLKIGLCLIVINTILLGYVSAQRLFISEAEITSNEPSKRDFCFLTMEQMIHKKLSPKLLEEALFDLVVRDNYSALFFKGNEKISGIWSGKESCKIMVQGKAPRSFDFYLTTDGKYPFYYKVRKITENELFEKEVE
jgi:hypothetical protein